MLELLQVASATFVLMLLAGLAWAYGARRELADLGRACDHAWDHVERLLRRRDEGLGPFLTLCEGAVGDDGPALLRQLAEARGRLASATSAHERARASGDVSAALRRVLAAALKRPLLPEGFPERKAQLEETEAQLADWSESYDLAVRRWNAQLTRVPDSLVAKLVKAQPRDSWRLPMAGGDSE